MDEETRLKARELLLRSRLYRFSGLAFAITGILLFIVLYFKYIHGDVLEAISNPLLVLIILFPFLPAFVLSGKAIKIEKQFVKLLEDKDVIAKENGKEGKPAKSDKS